MDGIFHLAWHERRRGDKGGYRPGRVMKQPISRGWHRATPRRSVRPRGAVARTGVALAGPRPGQRGPAAGFPDRPTECFFLSDQ